MTQKLFIEDAYLQSVSAKIVEVSEAGGLIVDATNFYAQGGGQPGDTGVAVANSGEEIAIISTVYTLDRQHIVHNVGASHGLKAGDVVTLKLNWPQRFARMQMHSALHLLTTVLAYPVTGGAIGEGEGRLDFDIPDAGLDKADIEQKLNVLIETNAEIRTQWITDEELLANPGLVKTMSVKPPMGSGRIRLVEIVGLDLQPCGGTHVARTGEIGYVEVRNIEKKGKQNRRIRLKLSQIA